MMQTKKITQISVLLLVAAWAPQRAWGWGSYGHEQINAVAVDALKGTPLGACLSRNRDLIVRLAITPDYDWKWLSTPPTDPELRRLKHEADTYEHPLHFFEADAFVPHDTFSVAGIPNLPSASKYLSVFPLYQSLLATNVDWVVLVDPTKKLADPEHPTSKEVGDHGTAPWRIIQLYDLAQAALERNDVEMGLIYLGAMGHYVGDMSQPFHASLNYDGQYYVPSAKGIHHTYEEAILEEAAKAKDRATMDKATKLWSSFAATNDKVMAEVQAIAGGSRLGGVTRETVIPQVLKMVADGYPSITPLLAAFTYASTGKLGKFPARGVASIVASVPEGSDSSSAPMAARAAAHSEEAPSAVTMATAVRITRSFAQLDYLDPKSKTPKITVLDLASKRMGASSALLAKIWVSLYENALRRNPGLDIAKCNAQAFNFEKVIRNYPKPQYLP